MRKKYFNLCLGIGVVLVLSLYLVLAGTVSAPVVWAEGNVTPVYDEGVFTINWTAITGDDAIANYTIHLWTNNTYTSSSQNATVTNYTGDFTAQGNYTFTIEALNASDAVRVNASNVSMYVDTTVPLVNWTNSGYTNLTKKKNTDTLTLNISVGDALSGVDDDFSFCVFDINDTNETVAVSSGWCNTTQLNLTGLPDGNHSIDVWANDTVNNVGVNLSTYFVWMDSTVPKVSTPVRPIVNGNYSGSIVLNVSIVETIGTTLVWFNITNGTGVSNGTAVASNGAGNFWNASLNTSLYPDGTYNVTVYANDTANNLNSSVYTGNFTIDNTAPVATFTCSPSNVNSGGIVTCTCTGTDTGGSGVNSSATVGTTTITTSTTGTHLVTGCSVTDYAGNSGTASDPSYTVTAGGGGSSTTALKWTGTFVINEEQFSEGNTKQLAIKKRVRFNVKNVNHHLGVLELTDTTAKIEVESTPQEATLSIGDVRKFDVSEDGYYDVIVTLNSILNSKADITIKSISELVTEETEAVEQEKDEVAEEKKAEDLDEEGISIFKKWWFWLIVVLVIVGIVYGKNFLKNE